LVRKRLVPPANALTLALSQRERELTEGFGGRYADVGYRGELRWVTAWVI
jgi:hypothetical protein